MERLNRLFPRKHIGDILLPPVQEEVEAEHGSLFDKLGCVGPVDWIRKYFVLISINTEKHRCTVKSALYHSLGRKPILTKIMI